jgi:predicted metal-binding membrane protein
VIEQVAARAPSRSRITVGIAAILLGGALATWIVAVERMQGMDAGPGTALGALGWYVGLWVTMMAAMMLPSIAPMVLLFSRVHAQRAARGQSFVPTWVFLAGYLAAWTAFGLLAYGLDRGIRALDLGFLDWDAQGPIVAGVAVAAAGLYQLSPLKRVCLRHCRSPLDFVMHHWRGGYRGALRMGTEHGAYCVGCCIGLVLVLFALGVMSVVWMAVVAALIFAEKILPLGERVARILGVLLVAVGIWIAVAPGSVPGLTEPGSAPSSQMDQMEQMEP